jgi:CO/xanthine dehydrogenase Mo-binding subunit
MTAETQAQSTQARATEVQPTQAQAVPELGRSRLRKEDARLVTGQTTWTDNLILPGMLHVAYVRSPYAHARITQVDVSRALQAPGIIAAFSGSPTPTCWLISATWTACGASGTTGTRCGSAR